MGHKNQKTSFMNTLSTLRQAGLKRFFEKIDNYIFKEL
jgi:hypothetical protein